MLPREHHKIDLSAFDPRNYTGATWAERVEKAKADASKTLEDYAENIKQREADQGFVTDKNTEIEIVEPKSTSYATPNEILRQIEEAIARPFGIPASLMGKRGGGYTAEFLGSGFAVTRAEVITQKICNRLEELLRKHLLAEFGFKEGSEGYDIVQRIFIRQKLILERDKSEIMRRIAIMYEGPFTPSEIRAEVGYDPLTPEQVEEIKQFRAIKGVSKHTSTPTEILEDFTTRRTPDTINRPPKYESQRERDFPA
jgi:hypothetical protein